MRWTGSLLLAAAALAGCGESGGDASGPGSPSASGAGGSGAGATNGAGAGATTGSGASGGAAAAAGGSGGSGASGGSTGAGIAARYPGDVGIENDPAVVWAENFEQGSVDAVLTRYEDYGNPEGMTLVPDVPAASSGSAALRLVAGGSGAEATDFYKRFDQDYGEIHVRYYVKHAAGAQYHHTGVWFGGYNPGADWPSPHAGEKPNGDDRFSISFEPTGGEANPRMDFYNYWSSMHSGPNLYYGNTLIHDTAVHAVDDQWMCVEVMLRLNPDPGSSAGAALGLRIDDAPVITFDEQGPVGYWLWDKFCPEGADGAECTDYPPDPGDPIVPLDQRYRTVADLGVDYFWPQNYITGAPEAPIWFDDMVVATEHIGCIQ